MSKICLLGVSWPHKSFSVDPALYTHRLGSLISSWRPTSYIHCKTDINSWRKIHIHTSPDFWRCFNIFNIREFQMMLLDWDCSHMALEWLDSQPIASNSTWNDLVQKFCTNFFPLAKIAKLNHDISIFRQGKFESFGKA